MKLYTFPKPKPHLRRRATSKGAPSTYWDHHTHAIRWMGKNALRRIHEARKRTGRFPTVDELQDWLEVHCVEARHYFGDFEQMAEDAAVFALDAFDQAEYDRRVARAVNGGKKSRRGKSFTTDQLREVDHLSIAKQAEKLGCSPATIKRRRADLKAEISAEQDEELDALFGPQEPIQAPVETTPEPVEAEPSPVPDTVPVDWLREMALEMRREDEARVSFDAFAEIEI